MVPCYFFLLWIALFARNCIVNYPGLLVTVVSTGLEPFPASKILLAMYFLCALWQVQLRYAYLVLENSKRAWGNSGFFKDTSSSREGYVL